MENARFTNKTNSLRDEANIYNQQFGNYLQAINQSSNLGNARFTNKTNSLNGEANIYNQQFSAEIQSANVREKIYQDEISNETSDLMNRANLYNAIFGNAMNTNQQQANLQNANFNNQMATINAQEQSYNQILGNTYGAYERAAKLVWDNYQIVSDAEKSKADNLAKTMGIYDRWFERMLQIYEADYQKEVSNLDYARRIFEERLQLAQVGNGIYDRIFAHAGKPIALLSAAQEAAQQPALRLWNASVGLNQSATGSLVALSNQGTRTTTTEQHVGAGQFWGGLFGGITSAFAGGLASGYGGALGNSFRG